MTYVNIIYVNMGCLFSVLKIKKCKDVIFFVFFGIFLCILKWLGATLKTYFYPKFQIKLCSRDQNTNKSQPSKKIYDKRCFLNMSIHHTKIVDLRGI